MTDPSLQSLGRHLETLARRLQPDHGRPPSPTAVVEVARSALACVDAGLTLVTPDRKPRTIAASSDVVTEVDRLQYEVGTGPCLDAAGGDDLVRSDDLTSEPRWQPFALRCAEQTGIRSMMSVRLDLTGDSRGAMNFYAQQPSSFAPDDEPVAALFAPFAAMALFAQVESQRAEELAVGLRSSRTIGTAVGIVMARELLTEDQAFQRLVEASQRLNLKLRDVAAQVRETGEVPRRDQ